jgi:hypothetical protein
MRCSRVRCHPSPLSSWVGVNNWLERLAVLARCFTTALASFHTSTVLYAAVWPCAPSDYHMTHSPPRASRRHTPHSAQLQASAQASHRPSRPSRGCCLLAVALSSPSMRLCSLSPLCSVA